MPRYACVLSFLLVLTACATSPLGRSQLMLFPDSQMNQLGLAAFDDVKQKTPQDTDPRTNKYVQCIVDGISRQAAGAAGITNWEVVVFQDDTANAFALPGGKIGVHTGIFKVARNQDQLAAVLAHEVGHVIARHSNERVSNAFAAQSALSLIQAIASANEYAHTNELMGLLGLGTQYGVLLPYSRTQESEADLIGVDLMARAGFDPRASLALWRNMQEAGGAQPPEFLSTHPSHSSRLRDLEARMPQALTLYNEAQRRGERPQCSRYAP